MTSITIAILGGTGHEGSGLGLRWAKAGHTVLIGSRVAAKAEAAAAELHGLGLGEPLPVSASHGLGTGDLLDRVTEELRAALGERPGGEAAEPPPRIAILGRPNVGKSSLLNALLGSERVIVSERAGTTRDPVDTDLDFEGRRVVLVDTAGLRRRSKVAGSVDNYAPQRAERAAERADVAILVCDASEGVTSEDLRIGELAMAAGCATLVALNKWDIVADRPRRRQGPDRAAAPAPATGDHDLGAFAMFEQRNAGQRPAGQRGDGRHRAAERDALVVDVRRQRRFHRQPGVVAAFQPRLHGLEQWDVAVEIVVDFLPVGHDGSPWCR